MATAKHVNSLKESLSNITPKCSEDFYKGTNVFALPNGDTYAGDFCAHRSGLIWREGHGFYYTQDGHIYEGQWLDDKLIDSTPISISYPNGDNFEGNLLKNKYNNSGEMLFKNGFRLLGNYKDNKPVGPFYVADNMGQLWKGMSPSSDKQKTDNIFCRQEHVFFNNIHNLRGIRKEKMKNIEPQWAKLESTVGDEEDSEVSLPLFDRNVEKSVFANKPKVDTKIVWEDTSWYQNFIKYKKTREVILSKVKSRQPLTESEKKWHRRYLISVKDRQAAIRQKSEKMGNVKPDTSLLHAFYSQKHKDSSMPYSTFYPSYYWHKNNTEEEEATESSEMESGIEEVACSEEHGSEESSEENEVSVEEEELLPATNPTIGCSTRSLVNFVQKMTGVDVSQTCESVI